MEPATIRLQDIARATGISADQAKYWCRLLNIHLTVRGRAGFISEADAVTLKEMARLIGEGGSPKESAEKLTGVHAVQVVSQPMIQPDAALVSRIEELEKTVLLMASEIQTLRQRRQPTEFERFYSSFFQPLPKILETCKQRYEFQLLMLPDLSSTVIEDHLTSS